MIWFIYLHIKLPNTLFSYVVWLEFLLISLHWIWLGQVLEIGIVVHSVIIGISLGASQSAKTIKPLVAALTFHQFFEGLGLGGCISQVLPLINFLYAKLQYISSWFVNLKGKK